MDNAGYEIDIRNANGDVEYMYCNKQPNQELFKPFFTILAYNKFFKNQIDLSAIYMKNRDREAYQDELELERERLTLLFKKYNGGTLDESEI